MAQLYNLLYIVRYTALILLIVTGSFSDKIGPEEKEANVVGKETGTVALKCSYETNSNYIWLYWYKQYPNSAPQFLLFKGARSRSHQERKPTDTRLEAKTTRDNTELTISGIKLSDSAFYHCALRDEDWYTEALTFGKPITLRVEPKDVPQMKPTLSILTSQDKTETLCLAAGFSPKEGNLSLFLDGKDSHKSVENAVLSTEDKTYYYAAFSKDGIDKCEMKGESITKGEGPAKDTPILPNCDQPGGNNVTSPNSTSYNAIMSHGDPKGNTMLLIVTGLRLVLAKAVGVNIMMTIKALLV